MSFLDQFRNAAPSDNATAMDATKDGWEEFAHGIDLVELDIAEVSSLATARGIWADRTTAAPGHHEQNLLEAVRVAIAQLKAVV